LTHTVVTDNRTDWRTNRRR